MKEIQERLDKQLNIIKVVMLGEALLALGLVLLLVLIFLWA